MRQSPDLADVDTKPRPPATVPNPPTISNGHSRRRRRILAMARSGQLSMLTGQLEDSVTPTQVAKTNEQAELADNRPTFVSPDTYPHAENEDVVGMHLSSDAECGGYEAGHATYCGDEHFGCFR
jgi:hypothetical protein